MEHGFKLDPGEKIIKIVHRHPFDVTPILSLAVVLGLAAVMLAYIMARFPETLPFPAGIMLLIIFLMLGLAGIIFAVGLFVYRNNLLIFTNEHLVQVEQISLFHRRVSQLSFLRVEDVSGHKTGILQTFFDFGDVQVQSAGESGKFIFKNAPHPTHLADEALEIHEECVRKEGVHEHHYDPELHAARKK